MSLIVSRKQRYQALWIHALRINVLMRYSQLNGTRKAPAVSRPQGLTPRMGSVHTTPVASLQLARFRLTGINYRTRTLIGLNMVRAELSGCWLGVRNFQPCFSCNGELLPILA